MNKTAVLHIVATGMVGAGVVISDTLVTVGLLAVGGVLFVAGVVLARRDGGGPDTDAAD
ncbi:MAG: hypothetical protein PPP55_03105 [Halorubrum sp.]